MWKGSKYEQNLEDFKIWRDNMQGGWPKFNIVHIELVFVNFNPELKLFASI
jgi:hypothetical protein